MDNELITTLAQARAQLDAVRKNRIAMLAEVTESAQYKAVLQSEAEATSALNAAEAEIKEQALGVFTATGSKRPHPAVGIRVTTKLVYDPDVALDWAKTNLLAAVALDGRMFEAFAKKKPLSFVGYNEVPTVTLASDLTEYMTDPLERLE